MGVPVRTRGCVGIELGPEVDPFFQVRDTRGQLGADREPSPPGPAGAGHLDLRLLGLGQGEELSCERVQIGTKGRVYLVPHDVEEPRIPAGGSYGSGDGLRFFPVRAAGGRVAPTSITGISVRHTRESNPVTTASRIRITRLAECLRIPQRRPISG